MEQAKTLWRLYTTNRANLPRITRQWFDAFTVSPATGAWRGVTEAAAVVEIIGHATDKARIRGLARDIRQTNTEDVVVIVEIPGVSYYEETGNDDDEPLRGDVTLPAVMTVQ